MTMKIKNIDKYIKKREDGSYYCDIKRKELRIRKIAETKQELIMYINKKICEYEIDNYEIKQILNIEYLFKEYISFKSVNWTEGTLINKHSYYKNYLFCIKNTLLSDIDINFIYKWKSSIKNNLSDVYKNKIYELMRNLLEFGIEKGHVKRINVKAILKLNYRYIKTDYGDDFITESQLKTLCDGIKKYNYGNTNTMTSDGLIFYIRFLFYTGCRINEARAVRVKDILEVVNYHNDKKEKTFQIVIEKQFKDNTNVCVPTKNKSTRYIYIEKEYYNEIKNYINNSNLSSEDYIFKKENSRMPISRKNLTENIKKVILNLKNKGMIITLPDNMHPHCFRYSNTLYLKKKGVPYTLAAYMHGHNPSLMLEVYDRIDKQEVNEIFGKIR